MLLGKPMEFRQEFVRPSVAYVTNKEMPAAKKPFGFQRAAPGRPLGVGTDGDARKPPEGLPIGFNVPDGPEGRVSGELLNVLFGHGNNASDLFDRCLEPCVAVRVFNGKSHPHPVNSLRSQCPHQDVLTAIGRCRSRRNPSGRSSAIFAHSSARPATTLS